MIRVLLLVLTFTFLVFDHATAGDMAEIPELDESVTRSMLLKDVAPVAPHELYSKGLSGQVTVKLLVDEQGFVREAKATEGPRKLRKYARAAALQRVYKPYLEDGYPLAFRTSATIFFPPEVSTAVCDALPDSALPEGVYRVTDGISAPQALSTPDPEYSEEARVERVIGTLCFSVVVAENGTTRDIVIRRGIGYGLDQKALEVLQQWRFKPALKEGQPIPVQISVSMSFRLY